MLNRQDPKQLERADPLVNTEETVIDKEVFTGLAPPYRDWASKTPHGYRWESESPKATSLLHRGCWPFICFVSQLQWAEKKKERESGVSFAFYLLTSFCLF